VARLLLEEPEEGVGNAHGLTIHCVYRQFKPLPTGAAIPLALLYKVEHAFARLGRWRRLSRCYEQTEASARAWLEVVCVAYLLVWLRAEPT